MYEIGVQIGVTWQIQLNDYARRLWVHGCDNFLG